jgi:outer membrane protein assembly factor BamA
MLRRVGKATFVGADFSFTNEFGFTLEEGGQLEQGNITGYNGGRGSALGLVATHDTRDNVVNAHKGHFAEVSTYFYRKALGGTFNFNNYNLTYQNYYAVKRKHILAYQFIARINTGDVPFLDMSTVGGDVLIRGYARNRFRDNNFVGTQLEYRFPVYKRLGMVAFAAAGDVFSATSDVGFNTIKYSIGTGFRLLMNPGERLNVRFDIGVGREGMEYYLMVSEAF